MDRRQFLVSLAAASLAAYAPSAAADTHYDVSYIWTSDRTQALDYMAQLKGLLGFEVAVRLELVQNGDDLYGVIYNLRYGSREDARDLARRHDTLLRDAFGGTEALDFLVTAVSDEKLRGSFGALRTPGGPTKRANRKFPV